MHAAAEFRRQRLIDHAVTIDAALAAEDFRHDINAEVSLPARPVTGMTLMPVRFIDDIEAFRRKGLRQFLRDLGFGLHALG